MNKKQVIVGYVAVAVLAVLHLAWRDDQGDGVYVMAAEGILIALPTVIFALRTRTGETRVSPAWLATSFAVALVLHTTNVITESMPSVDVPAVEVDMRGVESGLDGVASSLRDISSSIAAR